MSVRMMSMVWQHYRGSGGEMLLALALADHADETGAQIFRGVEGLAEKTRQSVRAVQRQLRVMEEAGWLICVERSDGGRRKHSVYRIAPGWVQDPDGFARSIQKEAETGANSGSCCDAGRGGNGDKMSPFGAEKPRQIVTVSPPETVTFATSSPGAALINDVNHPSPPLYSPPAPFEPGSAVPSDRVEDAEDQRLAAWFLLRLRSLNPGHREPNWRRWGREIRLMRERDGRSRRDIAELFAWANADAFWQRNVLSPGKLRDKWDQLQIARRAPSGHGVSGTAAGGAGAAGAGVDRQCTRVHQGVRCSRPAVVNRGPRVRVCLACNEVLEREAAGLAGVTGGA